MFQTNSLRFKVAFFYALFGAGLSILLSGLFYLAVQQVGHHLMDDILRSELDEHAASAEFTPPNENSVKGYILSKSVPGNEIPPEIKELPPGSYNLTIQDIDYRVWIEDRDGARYFMLYDTDGQHLNEDQFLYYVILFALFMTISSAIGGVILASRVTASVTGLARQVGQAKPGDLDMTLVKLSSNDEVGELARAFDRYLRRLRDFIERENYFTADVSHELRTPLAIMLGTVEVLESDSALTPKQKERIARIKRAAQDMTDLTSALLLMARERLYNPDELPCEVAELAKACAEKHRHLIGDRPIRLQLELVANPSLIVERPLLEIVIGNLVRNALFHTQSGVVVLRLEADRLIVSDTGIGMGPEELSRAMERHFKGPTSAGSGVGLSLVKRICDRYGWQILLQSERRQGTTAEIRFAGTK